jgi:hypothetical protein
LEKKLDFLSPEQGKLAEYSPEGQLLACCSKDDEDDDDDNEADQPLTNFVGRRCS